jgi:hypothetical protein
MKILYVSCFGENDPAERPLRSKLQEWRSAPIDLDVTQFSKAKPLREFLTAKDLGDYDILVIGAHGHPSKSGFLVGDEPVRWHDLAAALKRALPRNCTFVFYSCNGAYPGIGHALSKNGGPDFIFGPYIVVEGAAMVRAIQEIVELKKNGIKDGERASELVKSVNEWASVTYNNLYEKSFLRVVWKDGRKIHRYPDVRSKDRPQSPIIKLRGW